MSEDVKLLEFNGDRITLNILLTPEGVSEIKEAWSQVSGIQPPLVSGHKNGLNIFIPWILLGNEDEDDT